MGVLALVGLTACGAPAYTYVADSAAKTYYKVPSGWHQVPQQGLNAALTSVGLPTSGVWSSAFDALPAASGNHFLDFNVSQPFVFAEVIPLPSAASAQLSYNMLRDFLLPVTSNMRQQAAQSNFPMTNFTQLRDQTITASQGVHGVREIFQYTYLGATDTFDEDALTNADGTVVYYLLVHCTQKCYSQYQSNINTVMSSFTVGSPT